MPRRAISAETPDTNVASQKSHTIRAH